MVSVLHQLNIDQEIPLMRTTTQTQIDDSTVIPKGKNEASVSGDGVSITTQNDTSIANEERNMDHDNDSNSSGEMSLKHILPHSVSSNSNSDGYIAETVEWPNSSCCSNSTVKTNSQPVCGKGNVTASNPSLQVDKNAAVNVTLGVSNFKGYINESCSTNPGIMPRSADIHMNSIENALPNASRPITTGGTTTTDSFHTTDTTSMETQKASSLTSLNVITDLDQAFPLLSRFASGDTLDQSYYPAPSITPPYFLNKPHSQSNFISESPIHSEYPLDAIGFKRDTADSCHIPDLVSGSFSRSANTIPRLETHSPQYASSNLTPYTLKQCRQVAHNKNVCERDTTVDEMTPIYSDYINLPVQTPLFFEQRSSVVREECRTPTVSPHSHNTKNPTDSLDWNLPQQSLAPTFTSYNGVSYSPSHGSAQCHDTQESVLWNQELPASPLCHTDEPKNEYQRGFRNILFSLT